MRLVSPVEGNARFRALFAPALPRRGRWPALLVIAWAVQAVIRLALVAHQTTPVLIPDESGYLLAGRLLSGGAAADMSWRTFYQAGYSLLIAPAFWMSASPRTVYHLVLAMNSLVSATMVVLAFVTLRRVSVSRLPAYAVANLTALLPSVVYYAQFALSDAILPVVVLGWLLPAHSWLVRGRPAYGVAASVVAAYAYAVHARGVVILLVQAALVGFVLVRGWASRWSAVLSASALVMTTTLGWALNAWVRATIYPAGAAPLGTWLTGRLTSLDGLGWTLSIATGQLWYVIVSTFGLAGIGLVAFVVLAVRRGAERPVRVTAVLVLAAVAGIALATSATVPEEGTVANFAYGRYLSCLSPLLFLAGLTFLWRVPRAVAARAVLITGAVAALAAAIVWLHAGDRLTRYFFGPFDFPEICAMTGSWGALRVGSATAVGLVALALVVLVQIGYERRRGLLVAVAAFLVVDLVIAVACTDRLSRYWTREVDKASSLAPAGLTARDRVGVSYVGLPWRIWVSQAFQARNGLRPIDRFRAGALPPDVTLVVVPWDTRTPARSSWPTAPASWRPVFGNRGYAGGWVAWRPAR